MSKLKPLKKDWTKVETHLEELKSIFAGSGTTVKLKAAKKTTVKKGKVYEIKLIPKRSK